MRLSSEAKEKKERSREGLEIARKELAQLKQRNQELRKLVVTEDP